MTSESKISKSDRPLLSAIMGLLFGISLTFDLLQISVFPLESNMVVALPIVLLIVVFVLGKLAPLGCLRR
jgi:hypothetical protein